MKQARKAITMLAVVMLMLLCMSMGVYASDDNSLADLGITTEGVTVTPDFSYDTWTYEVTVPAGTSQLALTPVPSSESATIAEVSGTTLNADGTGTVLITVQAASGAQFTYTLHVTSAGGAPAAPETAAAQETEPPAPQTEAPVETEPPTEPVTEDSRFVRVDKNTIQEAENTITNLKSDIAKYQETVSLYTKIMYGLIAVAVILLFIIINLILRKRDLKAELNDYRSLAGGKQTKSQQPAVTAPRAAKAPAPVNNNLTGTPQQIRKPQENAAPQGQVSGQVRKGQIQYNTPTGTLDVTPQTSSHRERKLPEYQEEGQQVKAPAKAGQQTAAAPNPQPQSAGRTGGKNVEVDMIEL